MTALDERQGDGREGREGAAGSSKPVRYYHSQTPKAEFAMFPGSAHLTSVDVPETFADSVSRFLRSVEER